MADGTDGAEKSLHIFRTHQGGEALNKELPGRNVGLRVRLGNKLWEIVEEHVPALPRDPGGKGLQLADPLRCSQSQQEKGLPGEIPKRRLAKRLERGLRQEAEDNIQVPSRSNARTWATRLRGAGPDDVPQDRVSADVEAPDGKNSIKHSLIALHSGGR